MFVMTLAELIGVLEEETPKALLMEPRVEYDGCIVGLGYRFHDGPLAIYSVDKVLGVMMAEGMDEEEAQGNFSFNVIGGWVGEGTPIYVRDDEMLCDTSVASATCVSHGVPENCRERGF